ncbi:DNA-binding response regulator [Paenibacillus sp. 598K]|uniref:response regulator transcription factor n=1 Tax=Paenibacillus sp. 598K TaxID=1117987 RepID=UPI000FF9973F|nr:helix-turn-helix domain-containing protein [Paenibacillus sp. 598K]GBF74155.1 DNA-binding response regulator [Paenibacillus sp. 598K]
MYKVVLADDHSPVLEYLEQSIAWERLNLDLVAICADGEEAWEACQTYRPDILLTDIGMPAMDGLTLIQRAKEANPELQTIILSCHEEFHYAQKAVKLNVSDYLLKESLELDQVTTVLTEAVQRLDNVRQNRQSIHNLQRMVETNHATIRSRFLQTFLEQPLWSGADWFEQANSMGIKLRQDIPYMPVTVFVDRARELGQRFGGSVNMQFVIDNALQEALQVEDVLLFSLSERCYVLLVPFVHTLVRNRHEELRIALQAAQRDLYCHLKVSLTFFYGEAVQDLNRLKQQIQGVLANTSLRFYGGEASIRKAESVTTTTEDMFLHYAHTFQELRECIQQEDRDRVGSLLSDLNHELQSHKYPVESLKSWMLKMVMELELKFTVMQQFVTNFDSELYQQTLGSVETLEELVAWLEQFLLEKIKDVHAMWKTSVRKEVAEAQRYVLTHLSEKISMDAVAKKVGLNPTHFSRIFKLDTGSTFIEYATRCKMERACELLDQSNLSVVEIADQLGYDNPSYFIKLFRNLTGKSPAEYRKSL